MRRTDGGQGRERDAHAGRCWDAEPQHNGAGYPTGGAEAVAGSHRDAHAGSQRAAEPQHDGGGYPTGGAEVAARLQCDVRDGRHWGSESCRDGGEDPTDAAGTATGGPRSARWDAGPDNDGPAAALLQREIVGPVATPVPWQPDFAHDWWLSSL